jgi:transmembrane sensor
VETNNNHIENLIAKYLAGEASHEESAFVEEWINANATNRRYFEQINTIFQRAAAVKDVQSFNADEAWEKVRRRLPSQKIVALDLRQWQTPYLRIAASILLLAVASFTLYWFAFRPSQSYEVASVNKTMSDTLPDGTEIFLNKTSQIAYEYSLLKKEHKVKLKGEAHFRINHEADKSFLVDVQQIYIRDIGTTFNVEAYPDSATIEVFVEEGEVEFYSDANNGIRVKAQEKGIFNKADRTFTLVQPSPNETAYKTKIFAFRDMELQEISESLNEVYDTPIIVSDSLRACRISVNFNNENIEEIAQILAETLSLKVRKTPTALYLEGRGCND